MTVYAVVNLDGSDGNAEKLRHRLMDNLSSLEKGKRKVEAVVVVGAVSEEDVDVASITLDQVITLMNRMASNGPTFKRFVLLDKNNKGRAIGGDTGPPEDVNGKLIFLTNRICIKSLIKNRSSWWGQVVGKLRGQRKLRRFIK